MILFRRPGSSAFSLLELLVVIVVIAVLAGLVAPAFSLVRVRANGVKCLSLCRQIGLGFVSYQSDFDGRWPAPSYSWAERIWDQIGDGSNLNFISSEAGKKYLCPSHPHPEMATAWLRGYGMNCGLPPSVINPYDSFSCPLPIAIRRPALTALIGDSIGVACPTTGAFHLGSLYNAYQRDNYPGYIHGRSANLLFCDMHASSANREGVEAGWRESTDGGLLTSY